MRVEIEGRTPIKLWTTSPQGDVPVEDKALAQLRNIARLPFVYEIDTTDLLPEQTAMMVVQILQGRLAGHEAGSVDWSDEVLSWY